MHTYHVEGGIVHKLNVKGYILANDTHAIAVTVTDSWETPLSNILAVSKKGIAVQIAHGNVTDRTGLIAKGVQEDIVEASE